MEMLSDPLTPEMRAIVDSAPKRETFDIDEMRRGAREAALAWNEGALEDLTRTDENFHVGGSSRPAVSVSCNDEARQPVVFVHGGGWSVCGLETHLGVFADLARALDRPVWAPHPRQAPEAVYPHPLDDIVAALKLKASQQTPIAACGDSAGANLLLSALLKARDERMPMRASAVVLFYGCFRKTFDTTSHSEFGEGFGLTTEDMRYFWNLYAPQGGTYADLSGADFSGLPPIQLQLAECDPLADDTRWLHQRLKDAGSVCELIEWPGMAHGFLHHRSALSSVRAAFEAAARFLRRFG